MEGAQSLVVLTSLFQGDIIRDDPYDTSPISNLIQYFLREKGSQLPIPDKGVTLPK